MSFFFTLTSLAVVGVMLNGCSLMGHSAVKDAKSSNPAVATQAQVVLDLERQVAEQEKIIKQQKEVVRDGQRTLDDQKALSITQQKQLIGLKQQLDGANQSLRGVKTEAAAQ